MKNIATTKNRKRVRSNKGAISPILIFLVVFVLAAFAFAFDIAHNVLVRDQIQSAADAAALAGSYDLCLSGGLGNATTSPTQAATYSATASQDALAVCQANSADGYLIKTSDVQVYPCQYSNPSKVPPSGYNQNYYMTVTISRKISNWSAALFNHGNDTISATACAGPIGNAAAPNVAITPFPLAIYAPNGTNGSHTWIQQAGTSTLNVGILPLLTNGSTCQFISGPTGLLGGALATLGVGGNGNPTMAQMKYFDASQTGAFGPPSLTVGQTIMLMNPGVTGLNLNLGQAGPLSCESYMQTGNSTGTSILGLTAAAPSTTPGLAPAFAGKTYMVPVINNPNVSILSQPLASILLGGVGAQVTGFVPVTFSSVNAQPLTGLSVLGIVVLPPQFNVTATVGSSSLPTDIGLAN